MPAFQGGGEMIQLVNLQHSTYKDPPWKFEAGTPNIAGAIGWAAAIDYLSKIGMKNIQTHEKELIHYALKCLSEIKGLKIYGPLNNRGGVIAFNLDGVHPHDVAQVLDSESICIRAGHHCAQPLHKRLEQFGQLPSGFSATCRASFYLYNTRDDIDELIYGLDKVRKLFKII
jgi:cysteine desulfurase/selenocysteine lyase